MRIATKYTPPNRSDCFEASEGGFKVRIAAHRHTVIIDVETKDGSHQAEMQLPAFAYLLKSALDARKEKS